MKQTITSAELEIMNILWHQAELGAAEIIEALKDKQSWHPRTIKTLLSRLVDKGCLATKTDGRRYLYHPLITQKDYQKLAAGQLVDRLFGGKMAPLITELVDARGLNDEDIEALEALLGKLKK